MSSVLSISSILGSSGTPQASFQNIQRQRQSDFQALGQNLQAGNLAGAQQAYSALRQLIPATSAASASSAISGQSNPIANDMRSLGQALQSGNIASAQRDYAQFQNDLSASAQLRSGLHRYGHGHAMAAAAAASATGTPTMMGVGLSIKV